MPHYVGLDISQKTTAICVVDEQGKRLWRGVCTTGPELELTPSNRTRNGLGKDVLPG